MVRARWFTFPFVIVLVISACTSVRAEDGYELWLRYRLVRNTARLAEYRGILTHIVTAGESPTMRAARSELQRGLGGLLGVEIPLTVA